MTKPKKKRKPKELNRTVIGIHMYGGGRGPAKANLIYRITWDDGRFTTQRGYSITTMQGMQHLNGTAKEKAEAAKDFHPELYEHIQAAAILITRIEHACWELDQKRPIEQQDGA